MRQMLYKIYLYNQKTCKQLALQEVVDRLRRQHLHLIQTQWSPQTMLSLMPLLAQGEGKAEDLTINSADSEQRRWSQKPRLTLVEPGALIGRTGIYLEP